MVEIDIQTLTEDERSGGKLNIALEYNRDLFGQGQQTDLVNELQILSGEGIIVDNVERINVDMDKVVMRIEMTKTAIRIQALEDIRNIASAISGYRNLWTVCGDIHDHPEIVQ